MKPRLLVIVGRFVIGGHATDNIPLLYQLKEKYTIKIIYGEKEADEIEPLFLLKQYPGLDIEKLPGLRRKINAFADIRTLIEIFRCIRSFKPDIVHTHGAKAGFTGRLAARLWCVKVIVHTFHGHLFHSYFNRLVSLLIITAEKLLAVITDAAVALSATQQHEIVSKFKIFPFRKVFEIPLGLFQPESREFYKSNFRQKYFINDDEITVAIIGRIVPIKNHTEFLDIAAGILERGFRKVKFCIIGDGNEREKLENYLIQKKILFSLPDRPVHDAQIIFTSWIADMYEAIYEIDVVVLTSSNEGTPVSLIEAQLCGKPVVAYDVGGVKDTFINGVSGFLVPKGDKATFIDKVSALIENKELRETLGQKGRKFSSDKFSKEKEVAAIDHLYKTLLKTKYQSDKSTVRK